MGAAILLVRRHRPLSPVACLQRCPFPEPTEAGPRHSNLQPTNPTSQFWLSRSRLAPTAAAIPLLNRHHPLSAADYLRGCRFPELSEEEPQRLTLQTTNSAFLLYPSYLLARMEPAVQPM